MGEKIAQQEAQRIQMETEIREQIDDIHNDIREAGEHKGTSRKISEINCSQDDDGAEGNKEIDKIRNKLKSLELQIQKVNIDLGAQVKELRRGTALTHS